MTSFEHNPQAAQMADESMVRNLAAQAEAIWPQERALVARYALPAAGSILDVGCGTGEITLRLAELFPRASILGVDLLRQHLDRARERSNALAERVSFEVADAFELTRLGRRFDLVVCRHLLQAIPEPERVVQEMVRVARSHVLLSVPREPLWRALNMARGAYLRDLGNTPGHVNHWSTGAFLDLANRHGTIEALRTPFPWTMVLVRTG